MKKGNKILIPTIALSIFTVAGAVGIGSAFADDSQHSSIAQKIADRFSLNVDDVNKVFEEQQAERQAEMKQKQEDQLNSLVSEGKITEEQKQLLINKFEEKRAENESNKGNKSQNKEEFKNMTQEERKAERAQRQAEMDAWFEANGIDKELFSKMGENGPQGQRGPHGGNNGRK